MTDKNEILTVRKVVKDNDGTWCVKCPHCKQMRGLPSGPIRGEQFQCRCEGWFEVSHDAKAVLP